MRILLILFIIAICGTVYAEPKKGDTGILHYSPADMIYGEVGYIFIDYVECDSKDKSSCWINPDWRGTLNGWSGEHSVTAKPIYEDENIRLRRVRKGFVAYATYAPWGEKHLNMLRIQFHMCGVCHKRHRKPDNAIPIVKWLYKKERFPFNWTEEMTDNYKDWMWLGISDKHK